MKRLLPYSASFFINRIEELKKAKTLITNVIEKSSYARRILVFSGERGAGKTWFSLHLQRTYLKNEFTEQITMGKLFSFLICLNPPSNDKERENEIFLASFDSYSDIDTIIDSILIKFGKSIGAFASAVAGPYARTSWLIHALREKQESKETVVLIIDSIFEADTALVKKIELHLLSPIIELTNVAVILTGRGSVPVWETPELRLDKNEIIPLNSFVSELVKDQLVHLNDDVLSSGLDQETISSIHNRLAPLYRLSSSERNMINAKVYEISSGHPLNNYFLAVKLAEEVSSGKILSDSVVANALDNLANFLLDSHVEQRKYFEALCILDGFREWEVASLLDIYLNTKIYQKEPRQVRSVVNDLLSTHLIHWNEEKKVYVFNESVRYILEEFLKRRNYHLWQKLHMGALKLYQGWTEKRPNSQLFQQRFQYHVSILNYKNADENQVVNTGSALLSAEIK